MCVCGDVWMYNISCFCVALTVDGRRYGNCLNALDSSFNGYNTHWAGHNTDWLTTECLIDLKHYLSDRLIPCGLCEHDSEWSTCQFTGTCLLLQFMEMVALLSLATCKYCLLFEKKKTQISLTMTLTVTNTWSQHVTDCLYRVVKSQEQKSHQDSEAQSSSWGNKKRKKTDQKNIIFTDRYMHTHTHTHVHAHTHTHTVSL